MSFIKFCLTQQEDPVDERVEEDWVEMKEEPNNIVCLFCSEQSKTFDQVLAHMLATHSFDFVKVTDKFNFYQKVININRTEEQHEGI
jgi:hypothetical protein